MTSDREQMVRGEAGAYNFRHCVPYMDVCDFHLAAGKVLCAALGC